MEIYEDWLIHCEQFRYFIVSIDTVTWWSYFCLLSIRNLKSARLLAKIILLREIFFYNPIKRIYLDNVGEYSSHIFNSHWRIIIEHLLVYVHIHNDLSKSFILHVKNYSCFLSKYFLFKIFWCGVYIPIEPTL